MMKNRGALVALLVLGIATILMVFFVLPRIGGDNQAPKEALAPTTAEPSRQAEARAPVTPSTPDPAAIGAAANTKMVRLKQSADHAVSNLVALFGNGKIPTREAFSDGRAVVQAALEALAATELPNGIETAIADGIRKARAGASRALSLLRELPNDPNEAAAHIANISRALNGEEIVAVAPPAAPAPAPAAPPATAQPAAPPATAPQPVPTQQAAAPQTQVSQPRTDGAAPAAAPPEGLTPKFDVLRVEPDGWAVIAGNSLPGAKVEVVDGNNKVVAAAAAGPAGDFAAVLDIPLPPGNHALALRATDDNGNSATSIEVATVAVPEKGKGEQLLAMITKPGEASRVITMPEAPAAADKQPRVATEQTVAPVASPAADVSPAVETPGLPSGSALLSQTAPVITPESKSATTEVASAPATREPATSLAPVAVPVNLQVTAVEIEGDRIFIAGSATPGSAIRGYADDSLVGETKTEPTGHFVVEGRQALAVGDHTIRADMVDSAGNVVVRASVPFNRPPGEQVAAVAPAAEKPAPAETPAPAQTPVQADGAAFDKQRDALRRAFAILQGLFDAGKRPTLDALAAARSATEIALKSLVEFRPAADTAAPVAQRMGRASAAAGQALKLLQPMPRDAEAMASALPKLSALVAEVLADEPAPVAAEAAPAASVAVAAAPPATTEAARTIQQPPLAASPNSVIIRQGDTLWQISRRLYGQGVRYTTIYVANEKQIANPDRIAPGQIFTVPETALPNSEELHRRRLRGEKID